MPGMTVLALVDAIDPQPGQVVLIVGATGGIGGYATQLVAGAGAGSSRPLWRMKRTTCVAWVPPR